MIDKRPCEFCSLFVTEKSGCEIELFDCPFDDEPHRAWVHTDERIAAKVCPGDYGGRTCNELILDSWFTDFNYFECDHCGRTVCVRNPSNGWRTQGRITDDGEEICLRCYEEMILENGVEREKVERGEIPGMFFSHGNPEPLDAGCTEVEGFQDYFVQTKDQANCLCQKVLELMDAGQKVVIGYERLAIGGLEGYVSVFSKQP